MPRECRNGHQPRVFLKRHRENAQPHPAARLGQAQSIEAPPLPLCSDASSYMTGSDVVVDGGHRVSSP
ncbi:SDR family oxidoreductase [bacterium]|nr:SDR family oxidoreductase [bacterium]